MKIKGWNLYEIIWLLLFTTVAVLFTVIQKDTLLGLSVFISGVLCVVLTAKGNIWSYAFGMYNTFGYAYLAFTNQLYGEMGLNLFFFVPMNIVGFFMWKSRMIDDVVEMRGMKNKGRILTAVICVAGIAAMGFGLSLIPGQNTPYIDATTNVLSIAATFLMIWRYKEQWLLYVVLNMFTILMWGIRAAAGSPEGPMMIIMWSAYLINSVYGYYNWNKGSKKPNEMEQEIA